MRLFISVFSLIILIGCAGDEKEQQVLAERIQYDVPVVGDNMQLDWWINNIEGSKREPFLQRIVEAAEKGEVKVYDYFNSPLTPAQVMAAGSDTIYQTLLRAFPPYEEYDTMIIRAISYRDISKIRFLEEWKWDPASLEMEKKVLAIGPVVQKEIAGEKFNQLLFWIYFDEGMPGK